MKTAASKRNAHKLVFIVGFVIVVGIAVFAYTQLELKTLVNPAHNDRPAANTATELDGVIYLTLAREATDNPGAFALQPASGTFLQDLDSWQNGAASLFYSFSPNGNHTVFVGASTDEFNDAGGDRSQAFQVRRATVEPGAESGLFPTNSEVDADRQLFPDWHDSARITEEAIPLKRLPSINNAKSVLFVGRPDFDPEIDSALAPAEAWTIYQVGEEWSTEVVRGTHPKWVNDSKFIFMKNDGLYLYDTADSSQVRIWETPDGTLLSNMKLDLSNDGSLVAWTAPDAGNVTLLSVDSWEAARPNLELLGQIDVHGFWTVISPDAEFVAVQAVDWESLEDNPKPRIEFYSTETLEKLDYEFPLHEYNQQRMFMSDWRIN